MSYGWFYLFSMVFLSFVVAAVFSLNDQDGPRAVARATARRWAKLLGALLLCGLIVWLLSL